jgi:phosphoribosyl 1,2-cyclic phosphodiesterase
MPLNVCVLASGSSGNSTVVWTEKTGVLIDCGKSRKFILDSLAEINVDIGIIKGILVTHGHGDHVGHGMVTLSMNYRIPIYINEVTYKAVRTRHDCRKIKKIEDKLVYRHPAEKFTIGDIEVVPFESSHSGGYVGKSHGFVINHGSHKLGFLTDTGKVDEGMISFLCGCNSIVLEANHDPAMVEKSTRHYVNKSWILSDSGHLSNHDHALAIIKIKKQSAKDDALKNVFLAHISEEHNTLDNAISQITEKLSENHIVDVELIPTAHKIRSKILKIA